MSRAPIQQNIRAHDRVVDSYEETHGEIFNPVEQTRLRGALERAVRAIQTEGGSARSIHALDVGAGTGNLTRHLVELGATVTAADISPRCLRRIEQQYGASGRVQTLQLNGRDLAGIADNTFDLVATYSVLHHIPDYCAAIAEMCRVLMPDGILFIDHERSPAFWKNSSAYQQFLHRALPLRTKHWSRFFKPINYYYAARRIMNPRFEPEGDIHVWPDDHIEWDHVEETVRGAGCTVLERQDYLLYQRDYAQEVYEQYKEQCNDMRVMIARK